MDESSNIEDAFPKEPYVIPPELQTYYFPLFILFVVVPLVVYPILTFMLCIYLNYKRSAEDKTHLINLKEKIKKKIATKEKEIE